MNALELSIWMVYDTASGTSFQSNVIGWGCDDPLDGDVSVGAAGTPGGEGGVDVFASMSSLRDERVAPEDLEVAVPDPVEGADRGREVLREGRAGDVDVAGRIAGDVGPALGVRPAEEGREQQRGPVAFSSTMVASPPPLKVVSGAPAVTGKSAEFVPPVNQTLPAASRTTSLAESKSEPPTKVENTSAEPAAFTFVTKASPLL